MKCPKSIITWITSYDHLLYNPKDILTMTTNIHETMVVNIEHTWMSQLPHTEDGIHIYFILFININIASTYIQVTQ